MYGRSVTRREFIRLIGAGSAALALGNAIPNWAADRKPNIIVVLADDLGYADLGCQGAKDISTRNIDSIAANGARFTSGYVSAAMCSPSRAGLMTGRYQQRFGHEFNPGPTGQDENFGLPVSQATLASRLQAAGYATGAIGKWHLGKTPDREPRSRGFAEYFQNSEPAPDPKPAGWSEEEQETKSYGRAAVDFVDRHKNEQFFLYIAFSAPHAPLWADPKRVERFAHIKDETRRMFAAVMSEMDDAVGGVLEALRRNELEQDTLIFFLSDNGAPDKSNGSLNTPFRGYKMELYEGGVRVPFLMQWKDKVAAGKVYDKPVVSLDIAATALAAAGVSCEPGCLDGANLVPFLHGCSGTPHKTLYWRTGDRRAIRSGKWKLIRLDEQEPQLYDLASDPGEKCNLAAEMPAKTKELDALFAKWNSQLAKPRWQERAGGGE